MWWTSFSQPLIWHFNGSNLENLQIVACAQSHENEHFGVVMVTAAGICIAFGGGDDGDGDGGFVADDGGCVNNSCS